MKLHGSSETYVGTNPVLFSRRLSILGRSLPIADTRSEKCSEDWHQLLRHVPHKIQGHKCLYIQCNINGTSEMNIQTLIRLHSPCSQQPSALPYIGAYLDQIYSLEMNSKTCNPDGLVNFAKMTKVNCHSGSD